MSNSTKQNERSWAIQLIKLIETYSLKNNYVIKRVGGEETISKGKKKMFPDVLLFGDSAGSSIIQGWELKMPDVSIMDETFVKDSWRKAETLGLNSTFIWNFRQGVLYIKNTTTQKFEEAKRWDISDKITVNRDDVEMYQNTWIPVLYEAIDTINAYLATGKYREITIGDAISSTVLERIINDNKNSVADFLQEEQKSNLMLHNYLLFWWEEVRKEYSRGESNRNTAYAKVILLNWVTKFIVAHLIRQQNPVIEKLIDVDKDATPKQVLEMFKEITKQCDFYNIFSPMDYQELIPSETWNMLLELHFFLINNGLNIINQDDFQKILENTTKLSNRLVAGQFTTPKKLAEFMVKSTVLDARAICIDTCCGSGTIPKEIVEYKNTVLNSYEEAYASTYASDKYSFPLQISNISMTKTDTMNIPCRLFQRDVFDLKMGDCIEIVNPKDGSLINIKLDNISYVISNLPFIDFYRNNRDREERKKYTDSIIDEVENQTGVLLDNRSDYSFFIILHLWKLLKDGGKLCVVTSNSWVGTECGKKFFDALRYYYHVQNIYVSSAEKWFKNASIVTTIMLLEKKEIESEDDDFVTNYFRFNKKLSEITDSDMVKMVNSSLMLKEIDKNIISIVKHTKKEIDEVCEKYGFSRNIGFIKFNWIKDFDDIIKPMSKYFYCFPGIKSGDDNLFYDAGKTKVDKEYYTPLLKNTRFCTSYIIHADNYVINCDVDNYEELKSRGHLRTLEYFKMMENNLNLSTRSHGSAWWKIPQIENRAVLCTALAPNRRIFFGKLAEPCVVNQRLVGFYPLSNDVDVDLFHALSNSVLTMFMIEATGFGRGEGVLDLHRTKLSNISVLSPEVLTDTQRNDIKKAFGQIKNRNVESLLEDELTRPDRVRFDHTVLKAYGLDKHYGNIVDSLLELHHMRTCVKN